MKPRHALLGALLLIPAALPLAAATHFDTLCTHLWAEDPPGWQPTCSIASNALHYVPNLSPCAIEPDSVTIGNRTYDLDDYVACV